MSWEVEFTDEFETWWNSLMEEEQIELDAKVRLLEQHGPVLPRPHADVIVHLQTCKYERAAWKGGSFASSG